jgi:hypothetical protein
MNTSGSKDMRTTLESTRSVEYGEPSCNDQLGDWQREALNIAFFYGFLDLSFYFKKYDYLEIYKDIENLSFSK